MAILDFLAKSKTVPCARCNTAVKEKEAKQHGGKRYCPACYSIVTAPAKSTEQYAVQKGNVSGECHPAIQEIRQTLDAADLRNRVEHIGDQWELIAGINGKANSYQIKFICKENGKNDVALRVFSLCHFPQERRSNAYAVLNDLQRRYRFWRFVIDADGDVNVEYDLPGCSKNLGKTGVEMLVRTMRMIDDVYPELMKAVWA